MNTVSIVKCRNYESSEIDQALDKIFDDLGRISTFVKKNDLVIIKPNLLMASLPEENIITHPKLIEGIIKKVKTCYANPIIADSVAFGSVKKVAQSSGLLDIAKKYNVPIEEFSCPTRKNGLILDKLALNADVIINVPKLKVHNQILLTAGVKNLFGCVPGKRKAFAHFLSRGKMDKFSSMILKIYQTLKPQLTIVDSIVAMDQKGPTGGRPNNLGLIIAGNDALSVDMVICKILNLDPKKYGITNAALRKQLKEADYSNINILGEDINSFNDIDFKLPEKLESITFDIPRIIKSLIKHFWLRYIGTYEKKA